MIGALIVLAGVVVIQQLILIKGVYKMSAATDAYNAAVTKLTTDVNALTAAVTAGNQAAVDAFANAATAQINTIDAAVVAATPAPPAGA